MVIRTSDVREHEVWDRSGRFKVKLKRQSDVQALKQQGLTDQEIASQLGIAISTVRGAKPTYIAKRLNGRLTERERQVAELVATGMNSPAIAKELQVSERTVHAHRYRISQKLKANRPVEIAALLSKI